MTDRQETCHDCQHDWIHTFHTPSLKRSNSPRCSTLGCAIGIGVSGLDLVSILLMSCRPPAHSPGLKSKVETGLYGFIEKKSAVPRNSECYLLCILPEAMRRNLNQSKIC
jgi:hypothetical protein